MGIHKIVFWAVILLLLAGFIACRPELTAGPSTTTDTDLELPPAQSATPTPAPGSTPDPLIEQRNQIKKKLAAAGIAEIYHKPETADKTRGKPISVSGYVSGDPQLNKDKGKPLSSAPGKGISRIIQLPPDAYLEYTVLDLICAPQKKCPPPPIIGLARGNSRLALATTNGQVVLEETATGEKGAFDFLKKELPTIPYPSVSAESAVQVPSKVPRTNATKTYPQPKSHEEAIAALRQLEKDTGRAPGKIIAASGPETKGITLTIAGKKIKLPDDAFVEHNIVDAVGPAGGPRIETPVLVLKRGNSTLSISVTSGKIHEEKLAPGEEKAFDFLKKALQ